MSKEGICANDIHEAMESDVKWIYNSLKTNIMELGNDTLDLCLYTDSLGIEHIQTRSKEVDISDDSWEVHEYSEDVFPLESLDTLQDT